MGEESDAVKRGATSRLWENLGYAKDTEEANGVDTITATSQLVEAQDFVSLMEEASDAPTRLVASRWWEAQSFVLHMVGAGLIPPMSRRRWRQQQQAEAFVWHTVETSAAHTMTLR